jgi:hypothetical protein
MLYQANHPLRQAGHFSEAGHGDRLPFALLTQDGHHLRENRFTISALGHSQGLAKTKVDTIDYYSNSQACLPDDLAQTLTPAAHGRDPCAAALTFLR